jgi:hypothetical protein
VGHPSTITKRLVGALPAPVDYELGTHVQVLLMLLLIVIRHYGGIVGLELPKRFS